MPLRVVVGLLLAWLLVAALHGRALRSPPFADYLFIFLEADWLAHHDFDIRRLRYEGIDGANGSGPRVYVVSVIPTLIGLATRGWDDTAERLAAFHLATWVAGAATLVMVARSLAPRIGPAAALATSAWLATMPLFATSCEMIGLDLPATTFSLAAVIAAASGHWFWAPLLASLGFFCKANTVLVSFVLSMVLAAKCLVAWAEGNQGLLRRSAPALAVNLLVALGQWWIADWSGVIGARAADAPGTPARYLSFPDVIVIIPDVAAILATVSAGAAVVAAVGFAREAARQPGGVFRRALRALAVGFERYPLEILSLLVLGASTAAVAGYARLPIPRYFLLALVMASILFGRLLFSFPRTRAIGWILLMTSTLFSLFNANGRCYPSLDRLRSGPHVPLLERSGEYWPVHQANLEAARFLEQYVGVAPVVSAAPMAFLLSLTNAGAVSEPVSGYSLNGWGVRGLPSIEQAFTDRPERFIVVGQDNLLEKLGHASIPKTQGNVVFQDERAPGLVVFELRAPVDPDQDAAGYDRWLLETFWDDPELGRRPALSLVARGEMLAAAGRPDLARALFERGLARAPGDVDLELALAKWFLSAGQPKAAEEIARRVQTADMGNALALVVLGRCRQAEGDKAGARSHLARAARLAPDFEEAVLAWADFLASAGEASEAIRVLKSGLARRPRSAILWLAHGSLLASLGELAAAQDALSRAIALDNSLAQAHRLLGQIAERRGDDAAAIMYYQRAIHWDPRDPAGYAGLWLIYDRQGTIEPAALAAQQVVERTRDAGLQKPLLDWLAKHARVNDASAGTRKAWIRALSAAGRHGEAIEALNQLGAAGVNRDRSWIAAALGREKLAIRDEPGAAKAFRAAVAADPDDLESANALAWLLATSPDKTLQSPREALDLARRATAGPEPIEPGYLDTLAAAQAAAVDRAGAAGTEARAVRAARRAGRWADARRYERRRVQYERPPDGRG